MEDFASGVDSVTGSYDAAGAQRITAQDPDVPVDVGAAAFFDVDNTLIQGSSLVEFAFGLARRRYFRLSEILPIAWKQLKFRVSGSENAKDVAVGRAQALEFVKGRSVDELVELCEEIVDASLARRAYPGTTQLAEMHLAAGQQVWLVTATPVQLAQVLARRFEFTGALGTVAEVKDGKFTGRLVGDILHGPGKSTPWPRSRPSKASTSRAAPRIRIRPTTCPCCLWSAPPWPSTQTANCAISLATAAGSCVTIAPCAAPSAPMVCRRWPPPPFPMAAGATGGSEGR